MNAKRKDTAKEPSEVYETSANVDATAEELHPILIKLLEKSIQEAEEGKTFTHEEVMRMTKERYPFLK